MTDQAKNKLVLILFPGVDLLGMAFEEIGMCIVRGPDLLWGGDVRKFHPPPGVFWGVAGGPPCQDFSGLRRTAPTGYGLKMLDEFTRVVTEAAPEWWLMENVARVPDVTAPDYVTQRLDINNGWYGDSTRLRHIQFGSVTGRLLNVTRLSGVTATEGAALAGDRRSFDEVKRLQGLPPDFDLPGFLVSEKIRAVGNGVPLPMGRILAAAILEAYDQAVTVQFDLAGAVTAPGKCGCGCGRRVTGKQMYYDYSCRKRAQRRRDRARSQERDLARSQSRDPSMGHTAVTEPVTLP